MTLKSLKIKYLIKYVYIILAQMDKSIIEKKQYKEKIGGQPTQTTINPPTNGWLITLPYFMPIL
jgi:hypothetical protein